MKNKRGDWLLWALVIVAVCVLARLLGGCAPAPTLRIAGTTQPATLSRLFEWGEHPNETWDAVQFHTWASLNPAQGVYNWAPIYRYRDAVAPKRVHLLITVYRSDAGNLVFDGPAWAGAPKILTGCGTSAPIPPYDNATWRGHYMAFVAALGAELDGAEWLDSVVVSTGLDSETQPTKDTSCNWQEMIRGTGLEYRFGNNYIPEAVAAYARAFPNTTLYLSSAPGLGRMQRAELAASYGVGLKHAGMWYDLDSWEGYGGAEGSWDAMRAYSRTLPIWVESPHWGNAENLRWSLFAGLSYYPNGMSLHPDYFELVGRDLLDWTAAHLNVTAANAPSAWAVLRDYEYPASDWGGKGVRGHVGNWGQWLTVTGGDRRWRDQLPSAQDDWRSRQCRWGMTFTIAREPSYSRDAYKLFVTYLDVGTGPITLGIASTQRTNSGAWRTWETVVDGVGPWTLDLGAGGYVHMVELTGVQNVTETVTPYTPTATATWTPYPTMTSSPTATPSPTWTDTPTVTPSGTEIYTVTPTAPVTETATRTIEEEARALQNRIAEEWGMDGHVVVEVK